MKNVSLSDWILLGTTLLGFLTAWLARSNRLPKAVRTYLAKIGQGDIIALIEQAAAFKDSTADEKFAWVADELQKLARAKLGLNIPTSVVRLLVEYCYQLYKRTTKK